jgi:hypothetical protein
MTVAEEGFMHVTMKRTPQLGRLYRHREGIAFCEAADWHKGKEPPSEKAGLIRSITHYVH